MGDITELLQRWGDGDRKVENELFELVLPRLRQLARYLMSRERKGHPLQATELVNEAYLDLVSAKNVKWRNRGTFYAFAARVMRRHLIDIFRGQPKVEFVGLESLLDILPARASEMELAITVDRLLERLVQTNPDWCTVVELKCFLRFTDEEGSEALEINYRTYQRRWHEARRWLFENWGNANAVGR